MEIRKNLVLKTSINDQSVRTKIGTNVNKLRKNGKFTDVTLKTRDGTEIQVHRNIMARESSYFDSLFESQNNSGNQIINIFYNISGYHLELIIDYIYTRTIKIKFEDALELNEYANIFFIKTLEDETTKFLCSNINYITCLKYFRHAGKITNIYLEIKCLEYIEENTELFLENAIKEFNNKEIKFILSKWKISCSQEILLKNLINWIKSDFINRQSYIRELLQNINLVEISTKFIQENIIVDKDLMKLNVFQGLISSLLPDVNDPIISNSKIHNENLESISDNHSNIKTENSSDFTDEHLNPAKTKKNLHKLPKDIGTITNTKLKFITFSTTKMAELNLEYNSIEKLFKHGQRIKYSVNSFKSNLIFISGGGWFAGTKKCQIYCHKTKTLKLLPSMKSNRKFHRTIELNGKVYACGGLFNRSSMEYFDIESETWNVCKANLLAKEKEFGIVEYKNSLYTFGGDTSLSISRSVERFDSREKKWFILNTNGKDLCVTRSLQLNDYVYCFGSNFGHIYDIRNNCWRDKIIYPTGSTPFYNFDIVQVEDKILIGKSTLLAQSYNLLEYDIQANNWTDRNIDMQFFKGYMDFHIVKICN